MQSSLKNHYFFLIINYCTVLTLLHENLIFQIYVVLYRNSFCNNKPRTCPYLKLNSAFLRNAIRKTLNNANLLKKKKKINTSLKIKKKIRFNWNTLYFLTAIKLNISNSYILINCLLHMIFLHYIKEIYEELIYFAVRIIDIFLSMRVSLFCRNIYLY